MFPGRAGSSCSLSIGRLRLGLHAHGQGLSLAAPPGHCRFVTGGGPGGLHLSVALGPPERAGPCQPLCTDFPAWQIWRDRGDGLVITAGEHSRPRRQVTVDAGFRCGKVLVELDGAAAAPLYPLEGLEIVLFANWLAGSGDLILHASGVEFEGRGYCFVGESGTGKSTIAAAFRGCPGVTLLGEDNLVLRCLDGRFWVFGTPWHLDPASCSPREARLAKLFFLDRRLDAGLYGCSPARGVERLLQTAFVPYYRGDLLDGILSNLARLAAAVPFGILSHRLGSEPMDLVGET